MSIENPERFDYLKVQAYDPDDYDNHYHETYPLNCINRNSVHEKHTDNAEESISFEAFDDDRPGFKTLGEKARIIAGEQIYEITDYDKSVDGKSNSSVKADQIVNVNFKRVEQPRKMKYTTSSGTEKSETVSYLTLDDLISFFENGVDMMGFSFVIHGYFPRRPIKDVGHWNGKELLSKITETWPGTVIIPWGYQIHVYGFQEKRDDNGNLVSIRDIDTGVRFDSMSNLRDVKISRKTSTLCNAVEVKSATYQQKTNSKGDDDSEDTNQAVVMQTLPYFPNFLAYSEESVKKWGWHKADTILDGEFTNKEAAMAAAREKMITSPVISVTATVDHPGRTELQPIPGHKYTIGISNDSEAHHVILRGYDWYPFNPAKGAQLTLNSIDPGIVANLKTIILHDVELSPTMISFKALEQQQNGLADDEDDDEDSGDIDEENTDDSEDRPDDAGDGTDGKDDDKKKKKPKNGQEGSQTGVFLPIGSNPKFPRTYINDLGNFYLYKYSDNSAGNGRQFAISVVDDQEVMKELCDGTFVKKGIPDDDPDEPLNSPSTRAFMIDIDNANWVKGKNKVRSTYQPADFYFGRSFLLSSGMLGTQAGQFTLRANVPNEDFDFDSGVVKHNPDHVNKDGVEIYEDTTTSKGNNPGHLARLNVGPLYSTSTHKLSQLSTKQDVKPLDRKKALDTIMNTDIAEYRYKKEYDEEQSPEASVIIDDIHDNPEWKTPDVFKDKSGKYRNDSSLLAYTVKAVQELKHEVDDLKKENEDLKKQLQNK